MVGITERAATLGVETEFWDAFGRHQRVEPEVLERVVEALSGARESSPRMAPRTIILRRGRPSTITLTVSDDAEVRWQISNEGRVSSGRGNGRTLTLPDDLPFGPYSLRIEVPRPEGARTETCTLLVAPAQAYQGEDQSSRRWLLAVQLYGVRSRRNWGHGDFGDLMRLLELSAERGAAGVGLNPLHALFDDNAEDASPYSPSSRSFLNPLYIDVEAVPEFPGIEQAGLQQQLADLRERDIVDYAGVAAVKTQALQHAYEVFRERKDAQRQQEFEHFRKARGTTLRRYAAFELLRRRFKRPWWEWPEEWRSPTDAAIADLYSSEESGLAFFEYVQWLAESQLAECNRLAKQLGLPIGLYLDIAVGVRRDGFDAWDDQSAYISALSIGAPPDTLNVEGQNWGLTGLNPAALEAERFEPFRRMLAGSMRFAGAVRLDHVLGLKRLYLIPLGLPSDHGTYVQFPFEGLLAVTAQESVRHKCIVIGEDLGTVPEHFRETLADWGLWSYQVMMFERSSQGDFHPPEHYLGNALVTASTHDLPTFAGWVSSHDLREKERLGLPAPESEEERSKTRVALGRALRMDVGAGDFPAAVQYLARTPARLLAVSTEDIFGLKEQPNMPGTTDEHPNWRRRLPICLEDWADSDALAKIADIMAAASRGR